jgi:hypothetical protein
MSKSKSFSFTLKTTSIGTRILAVDAIETTLVKRGRRRRHCHSSKVNRVIEQKFVPIFIALCAVTVEHEHKKAGIRH